MKKKDAQLIISAVGRAVRKLLDPLRANITAIVERQTAAERALEEHRQKCAEIIAADIARLAATIKTPSVEEVADAVMKRIEPPRVPTAKEVAAEVTVAAPPSADEVAKLCMRDLPIDDIVKRVREQMPSAEQIAATVRMPTAKEVAAEVIVPVPPSAEEVAQLVLRQMPEVDSIVEKVQAKLPSAEQIAASVRVPTAKEVAAEVEVPAPPSADDVAQLVIRQMPEVDSIVEQVRAKLPSAAEIAKLVPVPELPEMPQLPELPHVPTLDEIMAGVKEVLPSMIPAPIKGDSISVDDVRPVIEELIKALPKPQDGKSLTIEDVRPLFAQWVLEFERRAVDRHDQILAQLPKPKDGRDGLGFEDLDVSMDLDAKEITIAFKREGVEPKSFKFFVPLLVHRGVYRPEAKYLEGDCVTRSGCTWMAVKTDPSGEPADGKSDDWRLIVKRGNDGRDATKKESTPTRVRVAPRRED